MTVAARELRIDAGCAGLPELAHGGFVAGLLSVALAAESTRVRLRRPVPTGQALRIVRPAPGAAELHDVTGLLAEAAATDVLVHVPPAVTPEAAQAASQRFPEAIGHPIPGCLVCGPAHANGLHVTPGPVSGRAVVAAYWVPPAAHADGDGILPAELVSAALDCPQLWALMLHVPPATSDRVVTSVLETRLEAPVRAGAPHVVMGWPIGRDGRRWLAGAAIVGPDGELCAAGRQAAAVVGGWGVPLGRDHWSAAPVATA